jgi:hypothetical protein
LTCNWAARKPCVKMTKPYDSKCQKHPLVLTFHWAETKPCDYVSNRLIHSNTTIPPPRKPPSDRSRSSLSNMLQGG